MNEIIISDLSKIVKNAEVLGAYANPDTWFAVDYETGDIRGKLLTTDSTARPQPIEFSPKLTGWYKIFISRISGGFTYLRLSDERTYTMIHGGTADNRPQSSQAYEWAEEFFWRAADLTGRDIVLSKHHKQNYSCALAWLRFVPMTDEEVEAYKAFENADGHRNLHVHYDNDSNLWDGSEKVEHAMLKLAQTRFDDTKIVTQEIMADNYDGRAFNDYTKALAWTAIVYDEENRKAALKQGEIHAARREMIHSFGADYYAGFRMSLASFSGASQPLMQEYFCESHPEYHMLTRDGRSVRICSYAYKEVQDYVIDLLINNVKIHGFDGISLICHRGNLIGFEQPVLDECARRFDGLDARRLPMDDPRLTEVHCAIMGDFIIRLHKEMDKALGKHIPINMIIGYNAENMGIDCVALAKAGAIDAITMDALAQYEVIDDYRAEDGLIDLEKYKAKLERYYTVYRALAYNFDRTKEELVRYLSASDTYGIDFYCGLSLYGIRSLSKLIEQGEELKALGVKNFSCYNHCHAVGNLTACRVLGKLGRDSIDPETYTVNFYRVLKYDDVDISTYLPL